MGESVKRTGARDIPKLTSVTLKRAFDGTDTFHVLKKVRRGEVARPRRIEWLPPATLIRPLRSFGMLEEIRFSTPPFV